MRRNASANCRQHSSVPRSAFKSCLSKVTVSLDEAFYNTEAIGLRNVRTKRLDSKAAVVFEPSRFERPYVHSERYSRTDTEWISFRQ